MDEQKVFLKGEVITEKDLIAIRNGYIYLHESTNNEEAKYQFIIAAGVCEQILDYLKRGKIPLKEIQ